MPRKYKARVPMFDKATRVITRIPDELLPAMGKNRSEFIRQAVYEKILRDAGELEEADGEEPRAR